jgi:uncharacterized protein (TIGR03435 family)
VAVATAQTPTPTFEVASVKYRGDQPLGIPPTKTSPNEFYRTETVAVLVRLAYGLLPLQLIGGPEWIRKSFYEVHAKAAEATSAEQMQLMLQSLLEERFKLVVRKEQREMQVYALRVALGDGRVGSKLSKCDPASVWKPLPVPSPYARLFRGQCVPVGSIARAASEAMNALVIDKTGLAGLWTYRIYYVSPNTPAGRQPVEDLFTFEAALKHELGLSLEATRGPVDVLVIESVLRPAEN